MQRVSSLLHSRYVLALNPLPVRVLQNHTVAINSGVITDVLPTAQAKEKYVSNDEVDLPSHVLMPGFVNCHTHSPMTLLRGFADDHPLMVWLQEHIWPVEGKFARSEFCRDGTELACAEMIRSGTTTFNDMYFYPEASAPTIKQAGLRAVLGSPILMFPTAWAQPDEYVSKAQALVDEFKSDPMIDITIAPHAPYTVTDEQLLNIKAVSQENDIRVHMHVHETAFEVKEAEEKQGTRPLQRLKDMGLLSKKLLAVHMTQLTDQEISVCAEEGVHVVHCPESNAKLASGFCPVQKLIDGSVNVALGTDGAASNNDLDMFGEMRTAAFLGKLAAGNAAAVDAQTCLRMATINGAKALGLDDKIGSIEVGKRADLVAVQLDNLECSPMYSVVSHLVYSAGRHNVRDVWVDGKQLLKDRQLTTLDEQAIAKRTREWQQRIQDGNADGLV